jgi:hypothetical protein
METEEKRATGHSLPGLAATGEENLAVATSEIGDLRLESFPFIA